MNRNNFIRALLSIAVAASFNGAVLAKELVIPTMPSAAQKKAEVVPAPAAPVNLADYGIVGDEQVAAPKAQAAAPVSESAAASKSPAAESGSDSKPKSGSADELIQISGGGRGNDLPKVPSGIAKTEAMGAESTEPAVSSLQEVVVTPGVNTIIPAAVNHLNRIVTPFENPIVQTVSSAQIKVKENVIYVSTESESPVTMYITPKDDEAVAISLTLAPRKVPPIQANLVIGGAIGSSSSAPGAPGAPGAYGRYSGQAKKWEENQPYMDSIKGIMRALALGQIPKGYSIGKAGRGDSVPACFQDGIGFDFSGAQVVMGHNFKVVVGVARNKAREPIMFDETSCTHPTLAATAVWPRNMLEPGDATEVYVVTRVGEPQSEESSRPSLLN